MKKFIVLACIIAAACIAPGCKKFEDGPAFSLLTKKARLTNDWKIEKYFYNGVDQTSLIQPFLGNYQLHIEKNGKYHITGNFPDEGTWVLGEDKDDLFLESTVNSAKEHPFRILRLKSKEFWTRQTQSNGDMVIIHFVPA